MLRIDNPTAIQRVMIRMEWLFYGHSITSVAGFLALWGAVGFALWKTRAWEHVPVWVLILGGAGLLLTIAAVGIGELYNDDRRLLQAMADEQTARENATQQ